MLQAVRRELDFYLVEKNEPDPWAYAAYHAEASANIYSDVYWAISRPALAFGSPVHDDRLHPEDATGQGTDEDLESTLAAYRSLDEISGGRYGEFLRRAARCRRCATDERIPTHKQPLPFLCGTAGLAGEDPKAFKRGHEALLSYRRPDVKACADPCPALGGHAWIDAVQPRGCAQP